MRQTEVAVGREEAVRRGTHVVLVPFLAITTAARAAVGTEDVILQAQSRNFPEYYEALAQIDFKAYSESVP